MFQSIDRIVLCDFVNDIDIWNYLNDAMCLYNQIWNFFTNFNAFQGMRNQDI